MTGLVGRDDALAALVAAAERAASGSGSIVVLAGEAGIGKTSVARALTSRVRDRLIGSWGSAFPDQSAPPFWPWQPLVDLDHPSDDEPSDQVIGSARFGQLTTLRARVQKLTVEQPRLHVIEDLQWADVASLLLLRHVGESITDTPLMIVATLRTGESLSDQAGEAIEAVNRVADTLHLPVLSASDIAALMKASGIDPDSSLVDVVQTRTDGNPLFVTELLRALAADPVRDRITVAAADVPDRVTDLVLQRMRRLPAVVADALATASVLGAAGDVGVLAAAHGLAVPATLDLLDQARAAHFLDAAPPGKWAFRHQLIRDAIYETLAAGERAKRHTRALDALAADASTPAASIAHHALAAQPLFDPDRAVALATRAGESSLAHYAYEEAVVWLTRALEAAPHTTAPRWRAELLLLIGEAHRAMGAIEDGRAAFLAAAELSDEPALLARAALGYVDPGTDLGIAYRTDDPVTVPLLERAIAAQPTDDSPEVVQLEARLGAVLYFSDQPARARQLTDSALARAHRLGDAAALVTAASLSHDAFVVGQADLATQLAGSAQILSWAEDARSVASRLTGHRSRVLDLLAAGDSSGMDAEILAFSRLAEPLRTPGLQWWPALWSAMRALLDGRHDVAEERAIAAFATGEKTFASLAFFNLSFLLFFLRREQGRLDEMEAAARDYASSRVDVPALRVAVAFLIAEQGRLDEARAALREFDDAAFDRLHDRNWPASWFQLARVAFLVGDVETAQRLLAPARVPTERCVQVSLATVCLGSVDLAVAWLHHAVGDLDRAHDHYQVAEEVNARIGARSWLAQAQADHARMLLARGHPDDAERARHLAATSHQTALDIGLAPLLATPPEPAAAVATSATFRRDGAVWHVAFAGRTVQVADARGLRDIAFLLARAGEAVSVLELEADGGTVTRGAEALDDRARREIRAQLRSLDEDEAEAEAAGDTEGAARARERRQLLAEAVARDFGLGGRSRRVGDPVERARKTVSTRIRRTIAAITKLHPELGRHLDRSVDTGAWCSYRPAEEIFWVL